MDLLIDYPIYLISSLTFIRAFSLSVLLVSFDSYKLNLDNKKQW